MPVDVQVLAAAAALWLGLRRWTALRWGAASLPFWIIANQQPWAMTAALGCTYAALYHYALAPVLVTRRLRTPGQPLPHLARGPMVVPAPRTWPGGTPSRALGWAAAGMGTVAVALLVASTRSAEPAVPLALALASGIVGGTGAFANWFATRVHLRVDSRGVHGRVLFAEHTVAWPEVRTLAVRQVSFGGGRIDYYCVRSASREVAFPSSLHDAAALCATIERATGVTWPRGRGSSQHAVTGGGHRSSTGR